MFKWSLEYKGGGNPPGGGCRLSPGKEGRETRVKPVYRKKKNAVPKAREGTREKKNGTNRTVKLHRAKCKFHPGSKTVGKTLNGGEWGTKGKSSHKRGGKKREKDNHKGTQFKRDGKVTRLEEAKKKTGSFSNEE